MRTQAYLETQNEILETHLPVTDFKALSIRVTSVTDKDTINAYIIDQEVYSAWISFFCFCCCFFFVFLPSEFYWFAKRCWASFRRGW